MKRITLAVALLIITSVGFAQETVQMRNGEKRIGKVQSLNNGVVDFLYKGTVQKIKTTDIYSINFVEGGEQIVPESQSQKSSDTFKGEPGEKQVSSGDYKVRYKVADRVISKPPKIDNLTQEKGTVVVEISIDKYGHVKKAVPGAPGSTTTSEYLKTKAMQAAQSAIFENVPTAPLEQSGYMVIVF